MSWGLDEKRYLKCSVWRKVSGVLAFSVVDTVLIPFDNMSACQSRNKIRWLKVVFLREATIEESMYLPKNVTKDGVQPRWSLERKQETEQSFKLLFFSFFEYLVWWLRSCTSSKSVQMIGQFPIRGAVGCLMEFLHRQQKQRAKRKWTVSNKFIVSGQRRPLFQDLQNASVHMSQNSGFKASVSAYLTSRKICGSKTGKQSWGWRAGRRTRILL